MHRETKIEHRRAARRRKIFFVFFAVVLAGVTALPKLLAQQESTSSASQTSAAVRFGLGGNAAAIPATFIDNLVFVPVRINDGKASLFQLDSSSNASSIDAARAKALDLQIQQGAQDAQDAASGTAGVVRDSVMNLHGVDVSTSLLPVVSKKDFGAQVGRVYEGTLGNDFFSRFVIRIDYGRRTMEIFDPGSFHYSGAGKAFPLAFAGSIPVIRAKFSTVTRKDIEGDFAVNTALDASVVILDRFAETHKLFSSHEKTLSALDPELGLTEHVAFERAKDFRVGSFIAVGTIIEFGHVEGLADDAHLAGEIGGGMLRRFNVVFDYAHRTMILEPNANFQNDDQEDKSGIAVIAEGSGLKTFKVVQVQDGTPGAEAGVRPGDVIAGIDDEAAADLTLADVRDLFRQIGHIYKLLIERDGKNMTVTMQMRRLLGS